MKKDTFLLLLFSVCIIFLVYIKIEPKEIKFLPNFKEWIKISKVEIYNRFNIKKYVGIAEKTYLKYGFKKLVHQEYVKDYNYVIVDIFKMKNNEKAKQFVVYIKDPNDEDIKIGDIGSKSNNQIFFLKKDYYVRVFTFSEDYRIEKELIKFAKYIDSKIS